MHLKVSCWGYAADCDCDCGLRDARAALAAHAAGIVRENPE